MVSNNVRRMKIKNYIGFVDDHSGSMQSLRHAAMKDYNTNITAIKDAASRDMLDTVVSVVGIGLGPDDRGREGYGVKRQVVISNPHVLKPVTDWPCPGGTPLWDGIGDMIELFESLPDYNSPDVSFLVMVTTDGQEQHSTRYSVTALANKIQKLQDTGRWTFVFRVPRGGRSYLNGLPVPFDNIQEWDTTTRGMEESTVVTTQAVNNYFTLRSSGAKSSSVFYANASKVDTSSLKDITDKVSLYVVPPTDNGVEIKPFVLRHRQQFLKGAAFYQLTKTEARVQPTKMIAVRDRATGKFYAGKEARQMIGLSTTDNARLHPGDHGNYDIFIQSESLNRKLVGGTGVMYWADVGVPFTDEDLNKYKPKTDANGVVQLPAVPVSTKPTPSPIPVTPKALTAGPTIKGRPVKFFDSREEARQYARQNFLPKGSLGDAVAMYGKANVAPNARWFVYL